MTSHVCLLVCSLLCFWTAFVSANDHSVQLHLRNCRQSSDFQDKSRCTGAIDGITNQVWSSARSLVTMATTKNETHPWWEAQQDQFTHFKRVRIFGRKDCCQNRMNDIAIKVDGHVCAEFKHPEGFALKTFECDRIGRVLRVESRAVHSYLTLAEVQAFGLELGPSTVAPQLHLSHCRQSSDYKTSRGTAACSGAIDGVTKQSAWSPQHFSTTGLDAKPWWQASTAAPSRVMQVRIFNRQDCCPERLNNFVIKVDGKVCAQYNSKASFSVWTFDCIGEGTTIRIESRVRTYLTLAEVQVFGEPAGVTPKAGVH